MGNSCKNDTKEEEEKILICKEDSPREKIKNKDIEILKKKIMNIPIFQRKIKAKEKYKKIIEERNKNGVNINQDNFMKEYLRIIELLLMNNTDKDIVSLYLNFIKENEIYVKSYNFDTFDNEIKIYIFVLTINETEKFQKGLKLQSGKDIIINFLTELSNIDDNNEKKINDFFTKAEDESKKIIYFNYPIEFSNKELYYYKIYILLILQINKVKKDSSKSKDDIYKYIRNKKNIAQLILNNKVLENEKIINNEDKMNILVILMIYEKLDEKKSSINFNRLLQTEKITFEELKSHILTNKIGTIKYVTDEYISFITEIDTSYDIYPNKVCLKNLDRVLLNSILNRMDDCMLNTLDSLLLKNDIIPYEEKIKKFLLKIVDSNVYKEAIKELFPEYSQNLLNSNLEDIKECINSRIKFYPYQKLRNTGLTDKLSCYSYIPIFFDITSTFEFRPILKCASIVDDSLHEINHLNQDILYFIGNDRSLFHSPKREGLKGEDGGENMEEILFGRKITLLKMLESFYILNEDNYEQSLEDFRMNFENLAKNNIDFSEKVKFIKCNNNNAIFREFFEMIKKI